MNYNYLYKIIINKKTIIYLLLGILIFIILSQMYYLKPTIFEGNAIRRDIKRARKKAEEAANKAREEAERQAESARRQAEAAARQAEEEARRQAEEAARQAQEAARQAEEAARLAEQLAIENAINNLLEPIRILKNAVSNTLNSLTNI
jgi:F0F1-type ATP synthase membrane subunit b/b'